MGVIGAAAALAAALAIQEDIVRIRWFDIDNIEDIGR
jgi:hypothetical protein